MKDKQASQAHSKSPLHHQRALGFSVFPVKGKVPLVSWHEFKYRLPTLAELDGWVAQFPGAGMAIVCGKVSKLAVLDVDPRHGGDVSVKAYPPLARTVWTGGGGWHYYFRVNESIPKRGNLLPGVDLQGEGSYVVAPPSIHPSGLPYKWVGKMLREIPQWLRALIAAKPGPLLLASGASLSLKTLQDIRAWIAAAKPGDRTMVRCPVHADEEPSVRLLVLPDGTLWTRCFSTANCHHSAILAALDEPIPEPA